MNSNQQLVKYLVDNWILNKNQIIDWFLSIDRKDFVLGEYKNSCYQDIPLPIGFWQTISQPTTVWLMIERLSPNYWEIVLDVWAWSWRTTAILSKIVGKDWKIYWTEIVPELVKYWNLNLRKYKIKNAKIFQSGDEIWLKKYWAYDKILVSASWNQVPQILIDQLQIWWKMVIPIKSSIFVISKISENKLDIKEHYWFAFVPLIE